MIKINLLPPEYRVKERTPLPMMMGILGGVAVCAVAVFGFLYVRLVMLNEAKADLEDVQKRRDDLALQAKNYDDLEREQKTLEARSDTVKNLEKSMYKWGRTIDELALLIDEAGKAKIHSWITGLEFETPTKQGVARGASGPPGGTLKFDLEIKGTEFDQIAQWRKMLLTDKKKWLSQNIKKTNPPTGHQKEYRDYIPPVVLNSKTEIELNPLVQPAAKPAKKPPAQQPKK